MSLIKNHLFSGYSGCLVYYQDDCVYKEAVNYPLDRLQRQIELHKFFLLKNRSDRIIIPKILWVSPSSYKMEYIFSLNIISYLESISLHQIDYFIDTIKDFIALNFLEGEIEVSGVIEKKFEEIRAKIEKPEHIERAFSKLYRGPLFVPRGYCHGDLTIDNILPLPSNYRFGLIDFLDSYITSPVIDFVKLRQDTHYKWCLHKYGVDSNKIRITLDYIDSWLPETPPILDFMNLARILPYCKTKETRDFLERSICEI